MSFSQDTNSFLINGVIDPTTRTSLGGKGFDFKFLREDDEEVLLPEDYTIPPGTQWKIALNKVTYINRRDCFIFPTPEASKTDEFNNSYHLYAIEFAFGALRYWPITLAEAGNHGEGVMHVLSEMQDYAKPFIGQHPNGESDFLTSNYFRTWWMCEVYRWFYEKNYDKLPTNKYTGSNSWDNNYAAAPVIRVNLLDVIERLGYKSNQSTNTYNLTAPQFCHVLNNLLSDDEITKIDRVKNIGGTGLRWHSTYPKDRFLGRDVAWNGTTKQQLPEFNITCTGKGVNGNYFPEMQIKIPLSIKYLAFGSILRNICGFQKISNTKQKNASSEDPEIRPSLSIIYDADANSYVAPATLKKITIKYDPNDPADNKEDKDAIIATPHFPQNFLDIPIADRYKTVRLWSFPRIPMIDGKERNFEAFLDTQAGNNEYDYLTIKSQYALNPSNAGDIFLFSDNSIVSGTHIGNYLSPLICQIPCPVYGFGYANLDNNSTKTMDLKNGSPIITYEPNQKEFMLITESRLRDFNINPRNAFRDLVQLPFIKMEFIIKRFK